MNYIYLNFFNLNKKFITPLITETKIVHSENIQFCAVLYPYFYFFLINLGVVITTGVGGALQNRHSHHQSQLGYLASLLRYISLMSLTKTATPLSVNIRLLIRLCCQKENVLLHLCT